MAAFIVRIEGRFDIHTPTEVRQYNVRAASIEEAVSLAVGMFRLLKLDFVRLEVVLAG